MTPEEVPVAMAQIGVDKTTLLSQKMLQFSLIRGDEDRASAISNAHVDFVLERVVNPQAGIYTIVPVPYQAPEEAATLIERVGGEPGIVGACMVTAGPEPPLGDHRYDLIYRAAESAGSAMISHAGGRGTRSGSR